MRDYRSREPGHDRDRGEMAHEIILNQIFGGRAGDRDYALKIYRAHNDTVEEYISPDRLLIYDVTQGWAPLCAFLGVAVPDAPFPNVNSAAQFSHRQTETPGPG